MPANQSGGTLAQGMLYGQTHSHLHRLAVDAEHSPASGGLGRISWRLPFPKSSGSSRKISTLPCSFSARYRIGKWRKYVSGVEEAVAEVAPFSVMVEGLGCFPEPRRPRVLWAGITTGSEQLQQVHALIEKPLHYLGFRREEHRYVPHITLGRLKADREVPRLPELLREYRSCRGGEMLASEICIMASQLERSGPIYTVMGRARFRGEPTPAEHGEADTSDEAEDFLDAGDEPLMD
jgi:2'-5' RNA ligase